MPHVNLQSSDGEIFKVDVEVAKCSQLLKNMLENLGVDEKEKEIVPLPNVEADILEKVIEWATYHKDNFEDNPEGNPEAKPQLPKNNENNQNKDDMSQWDADFLNVDMKTLYRLLNAANFLDMEVLLDQACVIVAIRLEGKKTEEIGRILNIDGAASTASVEEQVDEESKLCDEE